MTVYLDVVFFINLLYQLGILLILNGLFHLRATAGRIFAGASIGSAVYCGCLILGLPIAGYPLRLAVGALIGIASLLTAFFPMNGKRFAALGLAECVLTFCLDGILEAVAPDEKVSYLLLTGSAALVFMGLCCVKIKRLLMERMRTEKNVFELRLIHNNKLVPANGLLDTGNGLKDPISGEAAIIIEQSVKEMLFCGPLSEQKGYRVIPYGSIGTQKGILEAFRLERLEILKENQSGQDEVIIRTQVLCAVYEENFSAGGGYEVLLSPEIV